METVNLAKMNLAVNGLRGEIKKANTYYDDAHSSFGAFRPRRMRDVRSIQSKKSQLANAA